MRACLFFMMAILAVTLRADQAAEGDSKWVQTRPDKIVWTSKGTSKILQDNSIQLSDSDAYQEFTLYFQFPKSVKLQGMQLELMPSVSSRAPSDKTMMLFDVKPHLDHQGKRTTHLEFHDCTFPGDPDDVTTDHCIDFLSDTGWKVPAFTGDKASHPLLLKFAEPVVIDSKSLFAITIDSGGASDLQTLSRIRISFADDIVQ